MLKLKGTFSQTKAIVMKVRFQSIFMGLTIVQTKKNPSVIMYCLGGGWTIGDIDVSDRLVREIVNGTSTVVEFIDYFLSP